MAGHSSNLKGISCDLLDGRICTRRAVFSEIQRLYQEETKQNTLGVCTSLSRRAGENCHELPECLTGCDSGLRHLPIVY